MHRNRDTKKTRQDQPHESMDKTTKTISRPCGCRACARGIAAVQREIIHDVQRDGWSILGVLGEPSSPPFAYSIGLYQTLGQPEIAIVGLPVEDRAPIILHNIVDLMNEGVTFEDGTESDQVLDRYACTFCSVHRDFYQEYLGAAIWYYGGLDFPVLQCVYPDRKGRYPWQPGASSGFRASQPVLSLRHLPMQMNLTSNEEAQ